MERAQYCTSQRSVRSQSRRFVSHWNYHTHTHTLYLIDTNNNKKKREKEKYEFCFRRLRYWSSYYVQKYWMVEKSCGMSSVMRVEKKSAPHVLHGWLAYKRRRLLFCAKHFACHSFRIKIRKLHFVRLFLSFCFSFSLSICLYLSLSLFDFTIRANVRLHLLPMLLILMSMMMIILLLLLNLNFEKTK